MVRPDDDDGREMRVPWLLLTGIAAVLASSVIYYNSLNSSRPEPKSAARSFGFSEQNIDARLWQDPLEAVQSLPDDAADDDFQRQLHHIDLLREDLLSSVQAAEKSREEPPLVLCVMENGGPYPEQAEHRLRDRIAVSNALARAGFAPEDEEHIGCFTIPWPNPKSRTESTVENPAPVSSSEQPKWAIFGTLGHQPFSATLTALPAATPMAPSSSMVRTLHDLNPGAPPLPPKWKRGDDDPSWTQASNDHTWLTVPLEWFRRNPLDTDEFSKPGSGPNSKSPPRVLVLWLRGEMFAQSPLQQLGELLEWFQQGSTTISPFAILGPDDSGRLRTLLETLDKVPSTKKDTLRRTTMYSFRASASDEALLQNLPTLIPRSLKSVIEAATRPTVTVTGEDRFHFFRTILTDEKLVPAALNELERRWQRLPVRKHVALVGEWDSFYSKALMREFEIEFQKRSNALAEDGRQWEYPPLLKRTYLRGIDGRIAAPHAVAVTSTGSPGARPATAASNFEERTRRPREAPEGMDQSDYLRRLAGELVQSDADLRVQSAGLQRDGIDAVCIAGSDVYDKLQVLRALSPQLPGTVFLTTGLDARLFHPDELQATRNLIVISAYGLRLCDKLQGAIPPFRDSYQTATYASALCALGFIDEPTIFVDGKLTPRIYEIGVNGPVDLTMQSESEAGKDMLGSDFAGRQAQKNHGNQLYQGALVPIGLILLVSVVVTRRLFSNTTAMVCVAVLAIPPLISRFVQDPHAGGEPMALLSGISIWPGEALRLLAIFLSVNFVCKSLQTLKKNDVLVAKAYQLDGCRAGVWDGIRWTLDVAAEPKSRVVVQDLWKSYCRAASTPMRLAVTLVLFVVYLSCSIWVSAHSSSRIIVPARGDSAFVFDTVVLLLSVCANIFLTLFTLHATWLEVGFAIKLARGNTEWPKEVLNVNTSDPRQHSYLDELLDIEFLARHSVPVTRLVYYPFFTLALMILARLSWFDGWTWPPILLFIFGFQLSLLIGCVIALRAKSESARWRSIEYSEKSRWEARAGHMVTGAGIAASSAPRKRKGVGASTDNSESEEKGVIDTLDEIISRLRAQSTGSLAPISRQPLVAAMLLPSGSAGIWAALQYLPFGS